MVLLWFIIENLFGIEVQEQFLLSVLNALTNVIIIRYLLIKTSSNISDLIILKNNKLIYYLETVFIILGFLIVLSEIINYLTLYFPELSDNTVQKYMQSMPFILGIVDIVILPSVLEEVIFRGLILRGLLENYGYKFSIIFSSVLFGFMHFSILQGFSAFFMGIILGYLYWKYRSLLLVIFAHALSNFMALLTSHLLKHPDFSYMVERNTQSLWFTITGFIFLLFGIYISKTYGSKKVQK